MSIFPSQAVGEASEHLARYTIPTVEERGLIASVMHMPARMGRVTSIRKLDDGNFQVNIASGRPVSVHAHFVSPVGLRRLADRRDTVDALLRRDRDMGVHFGSANGLSPAARHRLATSIAARESRQAHMEEQREARREHQQGGAGRQHRGPEVIYKEAYALGLSGGSPDSVEPMLRRHGSFLAGFKAGQEARTGKGNAVQYGAGVVDNAWADITRETVDKASADLTCPKSPPQTTDYSKCTCAQLASKKAYWQSKEWSEPVGSSKREAYGTRVNAIAMYESICDQNKTGCSESNETTDYSKLDCGCLEAKRRYWVDAAGKEAVASAKRERYEARANHIATFKATCSSKKASSTASASSSTTSSTQAVAATTYPSPVSTTSVYPSVASPTYTETSLTYPGAAGLSATNALIAYQSGDYVSARQHAVNAQVAVDQASASGRPFFQAPRVRCATAWLQTGVMPAGCLGVPTGRPVQGGVPVRGPIYSRPVAPPRPARPIGHGGRAAVDASRVGRPAVSAASAPTFKASAAISSPRPDYSVLRGAMSRSALGLTGRGRSIFGGLDREDMIATANEDLFGGLDEEMDLFGGEEDDLFGIDDIDIDTDLFGVSRAALDPLFSDDGA